MDQTPRLGAARPPGGVGAKSSRPWA